MIGIIGGSGFYEFLKGKEKTIKTPFGFPSDKILISEYKGKKIAFLPRHGKKHKIPPHKIPYLANIFAFKKLGVERIISLTAVGSLKEKIKPGDFVVCDQFLNFTKRKDTFYDKKVVHIASAYPYCPEMRKIAIETCKKMKIRFHEKGTVVVIEGPRFSTSAESQFFSKFAHIINMTQYPEITLARELEICYLNISLVTDYDAGLKGKVKPVTAKEVLKIFKQNVEKSKKLIMKIIENLPEKRSCPCSQILKEATV